jgi:hypothetical protein
MLRYQRLASLEIHLFMSFFALLKSKFSIKKAEPVPKDRLSFYPYV